MPTYFYVCDACSHEYKKTHSMLFIETECPVCNVSGSLRRVPQLPTVVDGNDKTGQITKEFIQDAQQRLREQQDEMRDREFNK